MLNPAIVTEGLTRDFATVRAVDGISFTVASGTVLGFLGANGAGKTTTIRLLLGLLEPTHGRACVLGFDTRTQGDEIRTRTGALLEHTGLYERLSAEDNLDYYARIWHMRDGDRQARIKELLEHIGLWDRRREGVGKWSRGMKQKLAVARTLLHRPGLVFLDEPTAGLDPVAAVALREDLRTLATREGTTFFLTTHNLNEAEKLCNVVAVIRAGKLLAIGAPEELRARGAENRVVISARGLTRDMIDGLQSQPSVTGLTQNDDTLTIQMTQNADSAVLVSALVYAGARIDEVRRSQASLEDVFLSLMEMDAA